MAICSELSIIIPEGEKDGKRDKDRERRHRDKENGEHEEKKHRDKDKDRDREKRHRDKDRDRDRRKGDEVRDRLKPWGWDKMADIFQTTFPNAFSWMKMV